MDAEITRVKTYIQGLDEHLEGGVPKGSISLICGTPGSMKSSLAYSILYNNTTKGNAKALYITLEQDIESITKHMGRLNMEYTGKGNLRLVDYSNIEKSGKPTLKSNWFLMLKDYIQNMKKRQGFDLVVIDSLDALYSLTPDVDTRRDLYYFFKSLRETGATIFLISEMPLDKSTYSSYGVEDFLADAIIHLDFQKKGDVLSSLERYIGIVKMRATNHDTQYFPILYDKNKFVVYRREDLELE